MTSSVWKQRPPGPPWHPGRTSRVTDDRAPLSQNWLVKNHCLPLLIAWFNSALSGTVLAIQDIRRCELCIERGGGHERDGEWTTPQCHEVGKVSRFLQNLFLTLGSRTLFCFQSCCYYLIRQNGSNSKVVNNDFCMPTSGQQYSVIRESKRATKMPKKP
jgi:hypothetical protein